MYILDLITWIGPRIGGNRHDEGRLNATFYEGFGHIRPPGIREARVFTAGRGSRVPKVQCFRVPPKPANSKSTCFCLLLGPPVLRMPCFLVPFGPSIWPPVAGVPGAPGGVSGGGRVAPGTRKLRVFAVPRASGAGMYRVFSVRL